jgi:hypothetical protein
LWQSVQIETGRVPQASPAAEARRGGAWADARWPAVLTWLAIAVVLLGAGAWAAWAGLELRRDVWQSTRTIRFHADLAYAFYHGNNALREAEQVARLPSYADARAGRTLRELAALGQSGQAVRRLTWREVGRGIVHYYSDALTQGGDVNGYPYEGLDYPPLRLLVATLWVHHVQHQHPQYEAYPARMVVASDTSAPQVEDIAQPLLWLNTICDAVAAVGILALVWLWVARSGGWQRQPITWRGVAVYGIATAAFWGAAVALMHPPPRPTPVVALGGITPSADGTSAQVVGWVNSQMGFTRWRVQWGTTAAYSSSALSHSTIGSGRTVVVRETIKPLQPGQTIHLRLTAWNAAGPTDTADTVFRNDPGAPGVRFDAQSVGGVIWPGWNVWLALLALFITMIVCARNLPPIHRGWGCGLVAALLVWFDPITLIDTHVWPQWDVWILPVFVLAALAASLNCWLLAGVLVGIGCMAKGQLILAGPILVLWPLFGGRFGAALRVLSGFALGAALVVWPWILNSAVSRHWLAWFIGATAVYGLATIVIRSVWPRFKPWAISVIKTRHVTFVPKQIVSLFILTAAASLIVPTIIVVLSRAGRLPEIGHGRELVLIVLLLLLLPWVVARRSIKFWLAGIFAASIWSAGLLYQGNFDWWKLGFVYGSEKHDQMQMSMGSFANFPSLLLHRYHWDLHDPVGNLAVSIGKLAWSQDLDLKTSMVIVYGVTLVICSLAAAVHSRRRDPRILVALTVPWLIFPIIMCQTGSRYMLWPSALSAAMVAVSTGFSLLHVLMSLLATGMVAHQLLERDPGRWPMLQHVFDRLYPDLGWMMLLLAAVFLWGALTSTRRLGRS